MPAPRGNYRRNTSSAQSQKPAESKPSKRSPRKGSTTRRNAPVSKPSKERGRIQEILGVLMITMAILIGLACITYQKTDLYEPADLTTPKCLTLWELLISDCTGPNLNNAVGPVGALVAEAIIGKFFGYTSSILIVLLLVWGYRVLRKRPLRALLRPSAVTLAAMVYIGILIARVDLSLDRGQDVLILYSGAWGKEAALWLINAGGILGSYVILGFVLTVSLMLTIDGDIQRSLDRVEHLFASVKSMANRSKATMVKTLEEATAKDPTSEQLTWTDLDDSHEEKEQEKKPDPPTSNNGESSEPRQSEPERIVPPSLPPLTNQPDVEAPGTPEVKLSITEQVTEETAREVKPHTVHKDDTYDFPSIDLLDKSDSQSQHIDYDEIEENKQVLLDKLAVYKIEITNINAVVGPTVTLYELTPSPRVKISRIKSLEDDLAMAMAARGIRIIAPIPGKSAVGVEIPNRNREFVRVNAIIGTKRFRDAKMELPVALGKTIEGEVFIQDLTKMPHLLIAGATGSGKSVGLNTLIAGLLYACHPSNLKFVMVDPKKIELQQYRDLVNHFLAVPENGGEAIITEVADALGMLRACEREMSERYDLLQDARVRSVKEYNKLFHKGKLNSGKGHKHLPYIVVIIDELADLMMTAGKEIEAPIARLAQMARAIGIHLVLATQRPSVDVITGLIKANFPSRVAFQVASKIDARTILDQNGAEQLVGNGDMLYMSGSKLLRLQGPFVDVPEIDRLMDFISSQPGPGPYMLPPAEDEPTTTVSDSSSSTSNGRDKLFVEAARIVVLSQQGSVSLIQRKLSIGYTRAARIVDQLEEAGIVGAYAGAKAREVFVTDATALEELINK